MSLPPEFSGLDRLRSLHRERCSSYRLEYPTIQLGIDASSAGDTVLVASGTYFENLVIPHRLALLSNQGALQTAIDGQGTGTVIFIRNAAEGTVVSGFSVQNGYAETIAAGIFAEYCAVVIMNNIIEYNHALGGVAGLYAVGSSTIDNNLIQHNNLDAGKSVSALVASGTITRNTIRHNGAFGDFQIAWFLNGSLVTENVIADNGPVYAALALAGNVIARNNTIANNRAGTGVTIGGPTYEFTNNILHHPFGEGLSCGDGHQTIRCNDVWGPGGNHYVSECADNAGIDGNFSADPLFCDAAAGDYRIDPASPCAPENSAGCGLIGALPVCSAAAVTEPGISRVFLTVQPNPAHRDVELILDSEQPGAALEIYNSLGRLVDIVETGAHRSVTWTPPTREPVGGLLRPASRRHQDSRQIRRDSIAETRACLFRDHDLSGRPIAARRQPKIIRSRAKRLPIGMAAFPIEHMLASQCRPAEWSRHMPSHDVEDLQRHIGGRGEKKT